MAVWCDDFAFTVASEMLPHLTELVERNFECRLVGNIGPGMPLKVVKLLNQASSGMRTRSIPGLFS